MLKSVIGEDISQIFSTDLALELFMGWDKDKIEKNKRMKFKEAVAAAKQEYLIEQIKAKGSIDFKPDDDQEGKTFADILKDGINESFLESDDNSSDKEIDESGDEFTDESTGDELMEDETLNDESSDELMSDTGDEA